MIIFNKLVVGRLSKQSKQSQKMVTEAHPLMKKKKPNQILDEESQTLISGNHKARFDKNE